MIAIFCSVVFIVVAVVPIVALHQLRSVFLFISDAMQFNWRANKVHHPMHIDLLIYMLNMHSVCKQSIKLHKLNYPLNCSDGSISITLNGAHLIPFHIWI